MTASGTDELAAFEADYRRLWDLAASLGDPSDVFEDIGLFLEPPDGLTAWTYDATPEGALTFASTGGDGVHFSAVPVGGAVVVLMTVPMAFDKPNVVVGRDLGDFLALGCRSGYFGLEQLAYRPDEATRAIERANGGAASGALASLSEALALSPVTDVSGHLAELARYLPRSRS